MRASQHEVGDLAFRVRVNCTTKTKSTSKVGAYYIPSEVGDLVEVRLDRATYGAGSSMCGLTMCQSKAEDPLGIGFAVQSMKPKVPFDGLDCAQRQRYKGGSP